tara:strand:+ start:273 stop:701 length:429 start_codon:yes stop_codon:yes gene_type:complete
MQVVYKPVPPLNKFDFDGWKLKSKQGRFGDEDRYYFLYNPKTRKRGPALDYWWVMIQLGHYRNDDKENFGKRMLTRIVKTLSDNDGVLSRTTRKYYDGKSFTMNMFKDYLKGMNFSAIQQKYYRSPKSKVPSWVVSHSEWNK